MSLFSFNGKLLKSASGAASSQGCCCDEPEEDTDPSYPPPSGPDCACSVFGACTVQVTYDGLTVVLAQSDSPVTYYKEAGNHTYALSGGFQDTQTFGRSFGVLPINACTGVAAVVNGNCGIPNQSVLYHLAVSYGANLGFNTKNFFRSYYRYNLDADAAQPCPASVDNRDVTVSEVARIPGLNATANPADCGLSCAEGLRRRRFALEQTRLVTYVVRIAGFLVSYRWQNLAWATYTGAQAVPDPIRGAQLDDVDDEFWPCNVPIWDVSYPFVTVTCPP